MTAADSFRAAILESLGAAPDAVDADGEIHRFSTTSKRSDDSGWYVLHDDGLPAGAFGDWRTGYQENWCAKREQDLTPGEKRQLAKRVAEMRRQRDQARQQRHLDAAAVAVTRFAAAKPAGDHPYLAAKGVGAYGVRVEGRSLLIPMRDTAGRLMSVQSIDSNGEKRFQTGGKVSGAYHAIGKPHGTIIICEGYSTGASIYEATGQAVAIAFNAGNLQPVARALRMKYPCASLILAADDDHLTLGNPGREAAEQAALAVGGIAVHPIFPPGRPPKATDFNDLAQIAGPDAVRALFDEVLEAAG